VDVIEEFPFLVNKMSPYYDQTTERRNAMNMPGFTAEASLCKMGNFCTTTVTISQNTRESVQPARSRVCGILQGLLSSTTDPDGFNADPAWWPFFLGAMHGAGCFG
jgi:hypothetical protein